MGYSTKFTDELVFTRKPSKKTLETLRYIHQKQPEISNSYHYGIDYKEWDLDIPLPESHFGKHECCWSIINISNKYILRCQYSMPKDNSLFDTFLDYKSSDNKHYYYIDWLMYLMRNVFYPNNERIYGTLNWSGEDEEDFGRIIISGNYLNGHTSQVENDITIHSYNTDGYANCIPKGKTYCSKENKWHYPPKK